MCYSDGKNSKEAETCMTWSEYTAAAYKTLPKFFESEPDKKFFTERDLEDFESVLYVWSLPDEDFSIVL